jgi:hypothetical protein
MLFDILMYIHNGRRIGYNSPTYLYSIYLHSKMKFHTIVLLVLVIHYVTVSLGHTLNSHSTRGNLNKFGAVATTSSFVKFVMCSAAKTSVMLSSPPPIKFSRVCEFETVFSLMIDSIDVSLMIDESFTSVCKLFQSTFLYKL